MSMLLVVCACCSLMGIAVLGRLCVLLSRKAETMERELIATRGGDPTLINIEDIEKFLRSGPPERYGSDSRTIYFRFSKGAVKCTLDGYSMRSVELHGETARDAFQRARTEWKLWKQ